MFTTGRGRPLLAATILATAVGSGAIVGVTAAPPAAHAALTVEISGTATGFSVPVQPVRGTVCDPAAWGQPASAPCRLLLVGTWSAGSDALGPLHGSYLGWVTITPFGHAPGCLEAHGSLSYLARSASGAVVGRIVAPLDGSDSEVCRREPPARSYFLRADPQGGTGAFAGATGNWLVTGSGRPGAGPIYRDSYTLTGSFS